MEQQSKDSQMQEFTTAGEFEAFVNNKLKNKNTVVHSHSGLVTDEKASRFLSMMAEAYDGTNHPDMPYAFKETKLGSMLIKSHATETGSKAVNENNISQMKRITGVQDYSNDASGLHTLNLLREQLGKAAYISYLFGHMGHGKTDFALLNAEIAVKELGYDIASNIKSFSEEEGFTYCYTFGDLLHWLTGEKVESIKDVDTTKIDSGDKLFIFDEGSSNASGYAQHAHQTQAKLGELVKLIRKVNGSMIIIGHTGKDVHPDIRRLSQDCIIKTGKKTAEYYHSVEEAKGVGFKMEIDGIPKTNYWYDTKESTSWDWSVQTSEERKGAQENALLKEEKEKVDMNKRNAKIAHLAVETDMTNAAIGESDEVVELNGGDTLTGQRVGQIIRQMAEEAKNGELA